MSIAVCGLAVTPVKGTRLHAVAEIELDSDGARDDRRFFVIDERNRMLNGKQLGALHSVVAEFVDATLTLSFPDGSSAAGRAETGESISARFFSRTVDARVLNGPWAQALSAHVGRPVRLVEPAHPVVDRGHKGAASLISRGSLDRLAEAAGETHVDARRFRMLLEVEGIAPHEEDSWVGRTVSFGAAAVRFNGHVGRCLVTSRDPDTGEIDLPTLDILGSYRGELDSTEPLPFGIYGEVLRPGRVRIGSPVTPVE